MRTSTFGSKRFGRSPLWLVAFVLLLSMPRAFAQGVPGTPRGDWLAYDVEPFGVGYLERCGGTPVQLAEWRKTVEAVVAVIVTSPALASEPGGLTRTLP